MNRQYLKIGSELQLKNEKVRIVEIIGAGASCIVYRVEKDDEGYVHKYYLKECYPIDAQLVRSEDGTIEWLNKCEKEQYLDRFEKAYKMLFNLYSDEKFTNSTAMPLGICKLNGTAYYLMDIKTGIIFEEDTSQKLIDILATVIALSKLIDKYHKAGYLHLDIKPSNLFVLDETRELVVLFDVDSIVSKDMLKKGAIKHISFSKDYASPEQTTEKISEIDERTDIYSIGATLFEKIMGRYVTSFDRGIFADWNFDDNPMFDCINPITKKYIKEIFRKTLALKKEGRYENVSELIDALEEARSICGEKMFLISNCPIATTDFVGRKDDLKRINCALAEDTNVFLSGMGGIGKTELARQYANDHKDDYDTIVYLKYTGDLQSLIEDIKICGYTESLEESNDKIVEVKKLLNERTLLIIDNFDLYNNSKDEYLSRFLSEYNCKKIITTRNDFSQQKNAVQINIGELSKNESKKLFLKNYEKEMTEKDTEALDDVLAMVEYLTLCIPILAQQCNSSDISVSDLKEKLSVGIAELANMENITAYKDDDTVEDTVPQYMKAVFKMADLDDERKKVLSNLSLLQFMYVTKKGYIRTALYGVDDEKKCKGELDVLNSLAKQNLVKKRNENSESYYELHPIINTLVKENFIPTPDNCSEIFGYMRKFIKDSEKGYFCDEIHSRGDSYCENLFATFVDGIDLSIKENYKYLSEWLIENRRIIKDNLLLKIKNVLFKKKIYDNSDVPIIDYLMFFRRLPLRYKLENGKSEYVINSKEAEDVLNICFKSYKEGCIDADIFEKKILLKMCGRVSSENCEKKSVVDIDAETWEKFLSKYLGWKYEPPFRMTILDGTKTKITEEEFNNALLSINNAEVKEINPHSLDIIVEYIVEVVNDEKVINEVARIITNEGKLKEKAYFYSRRFLDCCRFNYMHGLDFDLCYKMTELSLYAGKRGLEIRKISAIGSLLIKAITYMLFGEKKNFLQQYKAVLEEAMAVNEKNWTDINKELLEILYIREVWTLPSQEFVEITEAYVANIEIYFKDFPYYDDICIKWYEFLLRCLQHSIDEKKRAVYERKLNKANGKIYGLEMKTQN